MIYIYNFANFDTVFLLKKLTKHGIVNSIIYKGKIVIVLLTFSNQKDFRLYIIHFRNSYQLLLSSLSKLGINFKINTIKDIFSYRFIKFNNLNYIGSVLLFEYFDNISHVNLNKLNISIPILYGQIANDIHLSYTGGLTDMFILFNSNLKLVYRYNINSLYSTIMQNKNFSIGKPTYFEEDIHKYDIEVFGFFYCKVEAFTNLIHLLI